MLGDAVRLQQIVGNIVGNAIKFTPAGGRVDVRARNDGADVVIVVSDTGRGIPRSFLPHVFEAFRQADPAAGRVHGGLGLGLAIVRALVELHHGAVEAESDGPGTGARFTVRVPLLKDAVAGRPVF